MKKLVFSSVFCLMAVLSYSQVEVKSNPIALLFEVIPLSIEACLSDDWGMELDMLTAEGDFIGYVSGKHYLSPKFGADRFNVGAFFSVLAGDGGTAGLGFFAGHKSVSTKNVVFEVALGAGRGFGDLEVIPYVKFHVGYRFNRKD